MAEILPICLPLSYRVNVRKCHLRKNTPVIIENCGSFQCLHQYKSSSEEKKNPTNEHSSLLRKGTQGPTATGGRCSGHDAAHTTARNDEFHSWTSCQNPRSLRGIRCLSKDISSLVFVISEQTSLLHTASTEDSLTLSASPIRLCSCHGRTALTKAAGNVC